MEWDGLLLEPVAVVALPASAPPPLRLIDIPPSSPFDRSPRRNSLVAPTNNDVRMYMLC